MLLQLLFGNINSFEATLAIRLELTLKLEQSFIVVNKQLELLNKFGLFAQVEC